MSLVSKSPSSASGAGWTNPNNVSTTDAAYATASWSRIFNVGDGVFEATDTGTLSAAFGFSGLFAVSGKVLGIEVNVIAKRSSTGPTSGSFFATARKAGVSAGTKSVGISASTDTNHTFGGSSDLWSSTWVPSDFTSSFSLDLHFLPSGGTGTGTISVDSILVTVYFETPNPFTFTDITNQPLNTSVESNAITVSGISSPASVTVTGGEWAKNGGGYSSSPGTVNNGDTVKVRHTTANSFSTAQNTTLSISGVSDTFTSTTAAQDTTPNAFTFNDVSNVNPSTVNVSNTVTVAGINSPAAISITGGEYSKNGGGFTTGAGTVVAGDQIQVRGTANASFNGVTNVALTIGGVSDTYTITTRAADTTPNAFTFTDQSGVGTSSVITSNTLTILGLEAAASVSFATGGSGSVHQYSKNGGAFTALGATTISNGDTLQLRLTSPAGAGATATITPTIGGVSDTWSVTTTTGDSTPDAFVFVDEPNAGQSIVTPSNEITITGIDLAATVTFGTSGTGSAHEYRKFTGGVWGSWVTLAGTTIINNEKLQVRLTAPAAIGDTAAIIMTVGGVADTFNVTAAPPDTTPNVFTFNDSSGVDVSTLAVSNTITVSGINAPAAITIDAGEYQINAGSWVSSPGTVSKGDTVTVRITSAATLSTTVSATLTIGGASDSFSVTTRSPDLASQYVVTFREAVYGHDV